MKWSLLKTLFILPGTVLVFVPGLIVWASAATRFAAVPASRMDALFWVGLAVGAVGLALMVWTVRIFITFGQGTPAPWDPPQKLVVRGPYRYVRNPMITGVLLFLMMEAFLLRSWPITVWLVVFLVANMIYFPLSEEKGLERRFGDAYRQYSAHVPRWIPRLRPWSPPEVADDGPPGSPADRDSDLPA